MAGDVVGPDVKWYIAGAYGVIHAILRIFGPAIVKALEANRADMEKQLAEERQRTAEALALGRAQADEALERLSKENAALRREERKRLEEIYELKIQLNNQEKSDER